MTDAPELKSRSGIPLNPWYGADGDEAPGQFPFTRGRLGSERGGGSWIQRELSGEGDPAASNAQIRYLISKGQMGIDVIGDSPTMGMLDPDHPLAINAIGTQGVSLCCKQDYLDLFDGLPLEKISVSSSVQPVFALAGYVLAARHAGLAAEKLRGSVLQAPFYGEDCGYALHMPFDLRLRLSTDAMEFCAKELPRFHSYVEDTYFFAESGLDAVDEMALGFYEIRHITRKLLSRGVPIDSFAPRIAILVNCSMDFFEEVAKIRATRRLFAKMMRDEFGARDPRSQSVVITSHTSGLTLTAQQPTNNIVRGTLQALSLVLGGVQALEISAFDEGFRTPSREAHLVGLRTQQILQLESGVTKVADPLGGSHYVEALTDEMENRIHERLKEIEAIGSPSQLSEHGWFAEVFQRAMADHQRRIDTGEQAMVGVNCHTIPEDEDTMLKEIVETKIEPVRERIGKIQAMRASRDQEQTLARLRAVREAAADPDDNLLPRVIDALNADATTGEISGAMRLAHGAPWDPYNRVEALI